MDKARWEEIDRMANRRLKILDRPVRDFEIVQALSALRRVASQPPDSPYADHSKALKVSHLPSAVFNAALREMLKVGVLVQRDKGRHRLYREKDFVGRSAPRGGD